MLLEVNKSAKRRYFTNYFSNFSNIMKKSLESKTNLMGRGNYKKTCEVNPMKVNDTLYTVSQQFANELSTYLAPKILNRYLL